MLQFFDDLPEDRWAAFLYVEHHARQQYLSESPTLEARRKYVQMILVAAHELKLLILPNWQSVGGLLYIVAGFGLNNDRDGNEEFVRFQRELDTVLPKIALLAKRGIELRRHPQELLDLAKQLR